MAKILALLGALVLAAACGPAGTNCNCIATGACYTNYNNTAETCGVGLVCCPPTSSADAG
jgi:hypothetical protein